MHLVVQATALICSAGMGLPVSGFPNLMAVNLEDEVGNRYLTVADFLKAGVRFMHPEGRNFEAEYTMLI